MMSSGIGLSGHRAARRSVNAGMAVIGGAGFGRARSGGPLRLDMQRPDARRPPVLQPILGPGAAAGMAAL
jgi:hypothetical protein